MRRSWRVGGCRRRGCGVFEEIVEGEEGEGEKREREESAERSIWKRGVVVDKRV